LISFRQLPPFQLYAFSTFSLRHSPASPPLHAFHFFDYADYAAMLIIDFSSMPLRH
jgi:hypothetical protein